MKDATRKLSKRYGDANFDDFISKGYVAEAIINYIALLGWCPKDNSEKMTMQEMIEKFSLDGVSKSPAIFDDVKLRWLNGEYLKAMDDEKFYEISEPFRKKSKTYGKYDGRLIAALLKSRIEIMDEIPEKIDFLEEYGEFDVQMFYHKKMKTDVELAKVVLPMIYDALNGLETFDHQSIHDSLIALATEKQLKNGQVLWTARVALTGKDVTPGGAVEMAEILGKDESLRRLKFAMDLLNK
jgi:glutamyl-tRNA synthetase